MARIAYVNGRYMRHDQAAVHIEDRGYQFADGVYEYIAFYNRVLLDGQQHLRRMQRNLEEMDISLPVAPGAFGIIIRELITRNKRHDGGLYIQITRGVAKREHAFPKKTRSSLVMTVCAPKTPKAQEVSQGVKVITMDDIRWGRCDVKSISLLANVIAKQEAVKQHVREAWLVKDHLEITEGAVSNSYIVTKEGELVTHPLDEHVLGGITRETILGIARKAGIKVAERAFNLVEIKTAQEAFLTSTSVNILPVVKVDDMLIGNGKPGPITKQLQELYQTYIFKQTGRML